ncbi:hypothetical protein DFQ28_004084 [Apophysomyces sp. BC1034]|nr:hypothetical protein DFQ28_004084 [Apophysomyces sp. BC1034]
MELRSGPPNNLQVVTPNILTAPVTVDKQSYTWNIPANTVTSTSYALVAKNSKNPAAATYAGPFTILGAAPGTVNTTTPAAGGSQSVPSNGSGAAATTGSGSTPSGANGASSGTPAATPTNAANGLKAGMVGVAGAVGAAVLLF